MLDFEKFGINGSEFRGAYQWTEQNASVQSPIFDIVSLEARFNDTIVVESGVLAEESSALLKEFLSERR